MSGKIYKHNPVIRGHMADSTDQSIDDKQKPIIIFDAFEMDLYNALYFFSQQSLWNSDPDMMDYQMITMRYSDVKKFLGISSNDFKAMAIAAMRKFLTTEIVLKSYTFESGKVIQGFHVAALSYFGEEVNYDPDVFEVHFNPILSRAIAQHNNNFTIVDMKKTRRLSGKYTKRLYEWLLSMKQVNKKIRCTLDDMNKLLGMEEDNFKQINKVLNRAYPKLFELINFTYEYSRSDKEIVFTFSTKQ